MGQLSFASVAYGEKKKVTRKEKFLGEMENVVPWGRILALIAPFYPRQSIKGRPPMPLCVMLRIYFMQQWFQLSDPGMEDALYDIESMRRFAGLELGQNAIPDETTILNFRHLLERHGLTKKIFSEVHSYLEENGLTVREGTIVDATIIAAPSSTKNQEKQRDPEMSSTKKGNQWHFGMKAHIGVDRRSGIVHTVVCTTASVHDSRELEELLHGEETSIHGDKAYADATKQKTFESNGIKWKVARKAKRGEKLSEKDEAWNRKVSSVRAKVEHPFRLVKNLWEYAEVRYKGIQKNACQIFTLFALANIYMMRGKILKLRGNCV